MRRFIHTTVACFLIILGGAPGTGAVRAAEDVAVMKNATGSANLSGVRRGTKYETISGRRVACNGFSWNYGYDVAFEEECVLVKVRINAVAEQGVARRSLALILPVWEKGIERIWSGQCALQASGGKRYPIIVDVSFQGPRFHHNVIVRPGSGRTDALHWAIQDSAELVAHEFGHMIGLFDEYRRGALESPTSLIDPTSIMTSNPGKEAVTHIRHYEAFREWFTDRIMISNVRIIHERGNHE